MNKKHQRLIGLTGGISTGKTTVSNYLAHRYQLPIFDADLYAREVVEPGTTAWKKIIDRYGITVQNSDRSLNRQRLGEIIFSDSDERQWLESAIHPQVRSRFLTAIQTSTAPIIVLAIPLLFEAKMTDLVSEIWVVRCDPIQQLERLMRRDRLTLEQAQTRINSQFPLNQKIAQADVILDNSSTPEALFKQIDAAIERD